MENTKLSTNRDHVGWGVDTRRYCDGMTTLPVETNPVTALGDWMAARPVAKTEQEHIERIQEYQRLRGQSDAAMAVEAAELERKRIAAEKAQQIPKADRGKGLAGEIALARTESPAKGKQFLDLARTLDHDLPHTKAALTAGKIREEHAQSIAKATEVLSSKHRRKVDSALKDRLGVAGPKDLGKQARAYAQSLEPSAAATRHRKANDSRRVATHPAGDGMAFFTAYGPAPVIQNMMNAVESKAKTIMNSGHSKDANGQKRTRDQVMFDVLAQWCTGKANPMAASKVDLVVLMTPQTLLGQSHTAAWLAGHGPIPAHIARQWLADEDLHVLLRRLFTDPTATQLLGMESRGRNFPAGLRKMMLMRDNGCRNPFCEATMKDGDHIEGHAKGGKTALNNGSGLCGYCNQLKENRGWKHTGDAQSLTVTTPTGHEYTKPPAPLLPGQEFEVEPLAAPVPEGPPTQGAPRPGSIPKRPPKTQPEPYRRKSHRIAITQYLRC
ncbi:HNH endonuclease [Enteractinococcus coprophilus]|uniref:HNH endonuclease n=2 Tax=Enteractinococcus coprophilus TaxID=1027633 RepID=A0A543AM39_9MICC|nr:HNH endonuclease [Enteractinococcus coprophilus]